MLLLPAVDGFWTFSIVIIKIMLGKYFSPASRMHMIARRSLHLSSVQQSDVATCKDTKWMGEYVKAVSMASDADSASHVDHVETWFRRNFRSLNARQALDVLEPLGRDTTEKAACFDSSFWIWESLEEAVRGEIHTLSGEEFKSVMRAFATNYKGSTDLFDMIEARVSLEGAELSL